MKRLSYTSPVSSGRKHFQSDFPGANCSPWCGNPEERAAAVDPVIGVSKVPALVQADMSRYLLVHAVRAPEVEFLPYSSVVGETVGNGSKLLFAIFQYY
jgi:hypothetical protein